MAKKKIRKAFRKFLKVVILAGIPVGVVSFLVDIFYTIKMIKMHPDGLFTTSPNYEHFSTFCPEIWDKATNAMLVWVVAMFAGIFAVALLAITEKKHR